MLRWISQMVEDFRCQMVSGVRRLLGEPIGKFRRGDVVVYIGCSTKFVVEREDGIEYKLSELYSGTKGGRYVFFVAKCDCESQYVRVGKWDFKWGEEVADAEVD